MMPYSKLEEKFISKLWLNSLEFKIHLVLHIPSLLFQVFNADRVSLELKFGLFYYDISIVDILTLTEYQNIGL